MPTRSFGWTGPRTATSTSRLVHSLGRVPTEVTAYLSFEADSPANFTTSSGNSALFEQVTDSYIDVHNDACPDFYLRVVASVPSGD
jgi:hypothetical protein